MLTSEDLIQGLRALSLMPRPRGAIIAGRKALERLTEGRIVQSDDEAASKLYGYDLIIDEERPWRLALVELWPHD